MTTTRYSHYGLTGTQIACQTMLTREGVRNMKNRKPYRTAKQKALAWKAATKRADGAYRSPVEVLYHR